MTTSVLLVDDDADVRGAVAALIRRQADLVLLAATGDADEALRIAAESAPDVVLMDVKMRSGGPALTREMLRRAADAKVVALSAYDDRGALLQMIDAGAVGYVVKGCPARELLDAIAAAVRGAVPLSPGASASLVRELSERLDLERRERTRRHDQRELVRTAMTGLRMLFQPIVRLSDGSWEGFEALSRFPHLDISTAEVFAAATEAELDERLEHAAVAQAMRQQDTLPDGVYMTVNVSPRLLVSDALREFAHASVDRLVLEVTEHAAVEDYEALRDALAPWRERGARLAVDDAGAGFASLRHILRLEPDFIKLDGSLTAGIVAGASERALAAALVAFANGTGAVIVAEGIEQVDQVEALRGLGVTLGQGYYLGRPRPAADFTAHAGTRDYAIDAR